MWNIISLWLDLHFANGYWCQDLFMCLLAIHTSSLEKCHWKMSLKFFSHFTVGLSLFLSWVLDIFWILDHYQIHDLQIYFSQPGLSFSLYWWCLFKHNSFRFWWSTHFQLFSCLFFWCYIPRIYCLIQDHTDSHLCFLLRIL